MLLHHIPTHLRRSNFDPALSRWNEQFLRRPLASELPAPSRRLDCLAHLLFCYALSLDSPLNSRPYKVYSVPVNGDGLRGLMPAPLDWVSKILASYGVLAFAQALPAVPSRVPTGTSAAYLSQLDSPARRMRATSCAEYIRSQHPKLMRRVSVGNSRRRPRTSSPLERRLPPSLLGS